jgi:hypothetical protein
MLARIVMAGGGSACITPDAVAAAISAVKTAGCEKSTTTRIDEFSHQLTVHAPCRTIKLKLSAAPMLKCIGHIFVALARVCVFQSIMWAYAREQDPSGEMGATCLAVAGPDIDADSTALQQLWAAGDLLSCCNVCSAHEAHIGK